MLLFNSTKSFFNALSETGNPMNYDGYTKWYNQYAAYVKEKKSGKPGIKCHQQPFKLCR
ncbi:hypothetical protein LWM68_11050 [Niabella sp. W65]|nr:hypothetical protein [Niabella sp. W65]MCH7363250.1 hypothetical protein [Niabella sp. W65]ULT39180.1 hypothetical protein KRR40_29800 [Niabella sp. I65]